MEAVASRGKVEVAREPRREKTLARSRDLLQNGRTQEALQTLNSLAAAATSPVKRARIASLLGDHAVRRGNFEEALKAYRSALTEVASDPREWIKPALGETRVLLRMADVETATSKARAIWTASRAQHEDVQRQLAINQAKLQKTGKIIIRKRPVRASVVGGKLGYLFLQEGEIGAAKEFFDNALSVNPQGGSRARQGLALIALAKGDFAEAERRAREALLLGKFQAKTIGVWPILIEARRKQSAEGLDQELLAGLMLVKTGSVRARAILTIARALRSQRDEAWKTISNDWLNREAATHPVVAVELRKLLGRNADRSLNLDRPNLLDSPQLLSRSEFVAAVKRTVRESLENNQAVNVQALVSQAVELFGKSAERKISGNIANTYLGAGRLDLARPLLHSVIAQSPNGPSRNKAFASLARLEMQSGNYTAAADAYAYLASAETVPKRSQLSARLGWARAMVQAGNPEAMKAAIPSLRTALSAIEDGELLLEFARGARGQGTELSALAQEALDRAIQIGVAQIGQAQNPAQRLDHLWKYSRRLTQDFFTYEPVVAIWDRLSDLQRAQLWSPSQKYWDSLKYVYKALYRITDRRPEAKQLMASMLSDTATPPQGRAILGVTSALESIRDGDYSAALEMFEWVVSQVGLHAQGSVAHAYYWLALKAYLAGRRDSAIELGVALDVALGTKQFALWQRMLKAKAAVIKSGLVITDAKSTADSEAGWAQRSILEDLQSLKGK